MRNSDRHTTIPPSQRPNEYRLWNFNRKLVRSTFTKVKDQSVNDIIEGCCKKKTEAQKQLYFQYCDVLYTTSYRIMNDTHLAEDALHDSYLLIYRDIKKLKSPASLLPWMKKIVINISLKTLQRNRRIEYTDETVFIDKSQSYDPMDGEQLEKAILMLPEGYRLVFLLTEVEGYKHQEVAELLGISEGTSKSQLHYAKQNLKKILLRKDY